MRTILNFVGYGIFWVSTALFVRWAMGPDKAPTVDQKRWQKEWDKIEEDIRR
jgi:hypothetical protein